MERDSQCRMEKSTDYKKNNQRIPAIQHKPGRKIKQGISPKPQTAVYKTIEALKLTDHSFILEIDRQNNHHLPFLFQQARGIGYYGIRFSEEVKEQTKSVEFFKKNDGYAELITLPTDGKLNFEDRFFDCCFMVNTIYFQAQPILIFKEIYRILRTGGLFHLTFTEKEFGRDLPWTQADFKFYELNELKTFLRISGFENIEVKQMTEELVATDGLKTMRPFIKIIGKK